MKNKKTEGFILIFLGLLIFACGFFIYFAANTIYPDSASSRVQDFNWLLNTLGKTGTALLICSVGLVPAYIGLKRLFNK